MAKSTVEEQKPKSWLAEPLVGTLLTIAAGLSFMFLGMLLPLVGKAGSVTPHAGKNYIAFLCALLVSLTLALLATLAKLARRRIDQSPLPVFSMILTGLCLLLLIALLLGLLKI